MLFLIPKRKRLIGVRFGDGLLLTESVVEDATASERNGTTVLQNGRLHKTLFVIKSFVN